MGSHVAGRARAEARRLLARFDIKTNDRIDLDLIARDRRATIVVGPLEGATARVVKVGDEAVIRVSDRIAHPGVARFSTAHELGHLVLGHALPRPGGLEPLASWARAAESASAVRLGLLDIDPEREADAFAAELLMPEAQLRRRCEVSPVDLGAARAIARANQPALVARAVRVGALTSERCAVVFAHRGRVQWAFRSASWSAMVPQGMPLDPASMAHDSMRARGIEDVAQAVPASAWIEDPRGDVEIMEHATALPDLRAVLALLWIPEAVAASLDAHA